MLSKICRRNDRGIAELISHLGFLNFQQETHHLSQTPSLPAGEPLNHPTHMAISFSPLSTREPADHLRGLKQSRNNTGIKRKKRGPQQKQRSCSRKDCARTHPYYGNDDSNSVPVHVIAHIYQCQPGLSIPIPIEQEKITALTAIYHVCHFPFSKTGEK